VKFARDRHGIANRVISNPFLGPPPAATAPPLPMQEAVLQPPPLQAAMPSVQSVGWHGLPMSRRDYLLGMPHANHPMAQQQMYGAAQHIHPSQHAASSVFYAAAGGGGVAHAMGCCSAAGCGCSGNFPSAATASSVGLAPAHGPGPAQEVSDSSPFPMPAGMCAAPSQRESSPWPVPGMAAAFPLPGAPTHAAMMGCGHPNMMGCGNNMSWCGGCGPLGCHSQSNMPPPLASTVPGLPQGFVGTPPPPPAPSAARSGGSHGVTGADRHIPASPHLPKETCRRRRPTRPTHAALSTR
jgi:hypothetical protein